MNKCSRFSGRYHAVVCSCEKCGNDKCQATQCSKCSGRVTIGHCASYRRPVKKKEGVA